MRVGLCCLAAAFVVIATPANAAWRKFETAHFIIYSESNDKRATELATGLENIDGLMRLATGLPMGNEAVKVRIYEMAGRGSGSGGDRRRQRGNCGLLHEQPAWTLCRDLAEGLFRRQRGLHS